MPTNWTPRLVNTSVPLMLAMTIATAVHGDMVCGFDTVAAAAAAGMNS